MNIKQRISKIEDKCLPKADCFCGKTFIELWRDNPDARPLTHCPKCKDKFDSWARLAADAKRDEPRCRNCGEFFDDLTDGCKMGLTMPQCCDFLNKQLLEENTDEY